MGVDMDPMFDNNCKIDPSPKPVVLSSRHQTKGKSKSIKQKPRSRNDKYDIISSEKEGFTEIKFHNFRSVSCKNLPSRDPEFECGKVLRRGSVYQSSTERKFGRPETGTSRKKIEFSLGNDTSFTFSILDSICGSDEDDEAQSLEHKNSLGAPSLDLKERQSGCGKSAERDLMENQKFKCDQVCGPSNFGNVLKERDTLALSKSVSSKLTLPRSPTHSEGRSSKGSSHSRFTPIKKMFEPFRKSKSSFSPLNDSKSSHSSSKEKDKVVRNSSLHDSSSDLPVIESDTRAVKKDKQPVSTPCSPAILNGNIKMELKHGGPYFEFSMTHLTDVFVAKPWKAEDDLNWVYTFHSVQSKMRSSATGSRIKYGNKNSPMVGQMQVSCQICSVSNSVVTEFTLYDLIHARKNLAAEKETNLTEISNLVAESNEESIKTNVDVDDVSDLVEPKRLSTSVVLDQNIKDFSTPYPWAPADLHPSLEIAGIVVQASLEKNQVKVNVVTPMGSHCLPSSVETRGPSPLLDRWRVGGGCDCGGWDVACPIAVFNNRVTKCSKEHSLLRKDQPLKLYTQGGKVQKPALTMKVTEKGQYAVDFHAQLSALQAFAVSVAILHTTEASSSLKQEKNQQIFQSNSLKVVVEDDAKILIEAVAEETMKVTKITNEHQTSFVLNPPFSPIARV